MPFDESTPIRSVAWLRACPSELSYPVYFQVFGYEPQLIVAKNGVIGNYLSDTRYATEKSVCY